MPSKKQNIILMNEFITKINSILNLENDRKLENVHYEYNRPTIDYHNGYVRFYQCNTNKEMILYLKGYINALNDYKKIMS